MTLVLKERHDRQGANTTQKLAEWMAGEARGLVVLRNPDSVLRFVDALMMAPIRQLVTAIPEGICRPEWTDCSHGKHGAEIISRAVLTLKRDTISSVRERIGTVSRAVIESEAEKRGLTSHCPWTPDDPVIAVHLRLEDVAHLPTDFRTTTAARLARRNMDRGFTYVPPPDGFDCQSPIDADVLLRVIGRIRESHPDDRLAFNLHLILMPGFAHQIPEALVREATGVHEMEEDEAVWAMINAQILVLSKSTFSLGAAMFHRGAEVWYPLWGCFVSHGLSTRYDRSGWHPFFCEPDHRDDTVESEDGSFLTDSAREANEFRLSSCRPVIWTERPDCG